MWVNPEQYKVVGAVLSEFRKQAKVRQQDLAAQLGKPQSFVSSYESGQRRIDVLELIRVAQAIGASPSKVFAEILRRQQSAP